MKKVAFLVQLPREVSPGQRFRIEQFEPYIRKSGISFDTFPFVNGAAYRIWYQPGHYGKKLLAIFQGLTGRLRFLFIARRYDYIFVQRELAPLGPPFFEWVLARLLHCKLILDFDDAIWLPNPGRSSFITRLVKQYNKTGRIARWAHKVSVGNLFLQRYARQFNSQVCLLPTCVDTILRYNRLKQHHEGLPVIGWTGSHSTLFYLDKLVPIIQKLEAQYAFTFLVICDRKPDLPIRSLQFRQWSKTTEIDDLLGIDIGVMPLIADAWSEGKCGFKLIQYMALGIPAIASNVGVNGNIVEQYKSGFLCDKEAQWLDALEALLTNTALRSRMGIEARRKIENDYSVAGVVSEFLALFK